MVVETKATLKVVSTRVKCVLIYLNKEKATVTMEYNCNSLFPKQQPILAKRYRVLL